MFLTNSRAAAFLLFLLALALKEKLFKGTALARDALGVTAPFQPRSRLHLGPDGSQEKPPGAGLPEAP